MLTEQFNYHLPPLLIAQQPAGKRTDSRLLVMDADDGFIDMQFKQMPTLLNQGDLLVVNDTKVLPARITGYKPTGGKVEIMLERVVSDSIAIVLIGINKKVRLGQLIQVADYTLEVLGQNDGFFTIGVQQSISIASLFDECGELALPHYIQRDQKINQQDWERYQTVYAKNPGAVAAPTAGLHFDDVILQRLKDKGVSIGSVTLHVGAGTFQPVRVKSIESHHMHAERILVSADLCDQIKETKGRGDRVIAVGTTVVRALESAGQSGMIHPMDGDTSLFIYPGYQFNIVDGLFTNFHLPKSTLLMMVCAFAGYDDVMSGYQYAIDRNFRFYSYGDAMFVGR